MAIPPAAIALVVGAFVIWVAALAFIRLRSDEEIESMISKLSGKSDTTAEGEVMVAEIVEENPS